MSTKLENASPQNHRSSPLADRHPVDSVFPPRSTSSGSTWTTGAKGGMGTAFYEPSLGPSVSNVWFTLAHGVLTEVYYPTVSQPNLQTMQFVISDGKTFIDYESADTEHQCTLLTCKGLVYQQINTSNSHKYQVSKTYITDPNRHTVLIQVEFQVQAGSLSDYDLFLYINPVLSNNANDDMVQIKRTSDGTCIVAQDSQTSMAVLSTLPITTVTAKNIGDAPSITDWTQQVLDADEQTNTSVAEGPGDIHILAQLDSHGQQNHVSFTIALGFGTSVEAAMQETLASLHFPFSTVASNYIRGWESYVERLDPPSAGSSVQYYASAMTLKAHEDKLHPGAIVASLSIPWGQSVPASDSNIGGYHLVWVRDLYQIASSLAAIGDRPTAHRALAYLAAILQRPDGSFPQNAWVDGTPYWHGLQHDQVAFPVLLAHQLGGNKFYLSLVKPAADFLLRHGPWTDQERWEENSGYSPSTMAASIAALVVAAEMAREHGDYTPAAHYLAKADKWFAQLDALTVSKRGPLSSHPYYIRINNTLDPDDDDWIEIKNGGGWHRKNEIVDAGFLELVRLGMKAPDDALITNSLNVIDKVLMYETPHGPAWYRYNHDGYGEHTDGSPYDGSGHGRPWPVLTGERGEYEVALAASACRTSPKQVFGADRLLAALECLANEGLMIPEQVWDDFSPGPWGIHPTGGTGSATPLAWAMAQYLRLSKCIETGRIVEMPTIVQERYLSPRSTDFSLQITTPSPKSHQSAENTVVKGVTKPHATVIVIHEQHVLSSVKANQSGHFATSFHLTEIGEQRIEVVAYDELQSIRYETLVISCYPEALIELEGLCEQKTGWITYPTNPAFKPGDFELKRVRVFADSERMYFELQLGNLDNPWRAPSGISKQLVDIYIDTDGLPNLGQRWTMGLNARFTCDSAWEKLIRVSGNWHGEAHVYNSDWSDAGSVDIRPIYETNVILASVPLSVLGNSPQPGWGIMVLLAGEHEGSVRGVTHDATEWNFGCSAAFRNPPQFVDFTLPVEVSLNSVLKKSEEDPYLELPMNRMKL